jgi:pimeloyl-ACP methyl ester carboxylesterase
VEGLAMPYANNQDVRIHYKVEGEGLPLVLQHGFTDSLESWYEFGYVDALQSDYQLILIDARGHGQSDKPHEPAAYSGPKFTADVVAVLDALALPKAHFFGYSMGGRIGFDIAEHAPNRVYSLILGGNHPYQPPSAADDPWIPMLQKGADIIPSIWSVPLSSSLEARLVQNDVEALVAIRQNRGGRRGAEDLLPKMSMPCLLYAGEGDPYCPRVKECSTQIPNAAFVSVPDLGHADTFFRSDLILPEIKQFLDNLQS